MKKLNELDLSSKKVIIFDVDGTLIDSIGIWNKTDGMIIEKYGHVIVDEFIIQKDRDLFLSSNNDKDIYVAYASYLIEKYNMNITVDEFIQERYGNVQYYFINEVDFKESVDEVIKKFKSMGYKLAIATTTTKNQIDIYSNKNKNMLNKLNISEVFDYIVTKEDIKYKKPNPEVYEKIINYFNVLPSECLVFEDSLHGVISAISAGIEVVNVKDKYSLDKSKEIEEITNYKIDSFKEILELF